jgi:hypothetical protein
MTQKSDELQVQAWRRAAAGPADSEASELKRSLRASARRAALAAGRASGWFAIRV